MHPVNEVNDVIRAVGKVRGDLAVREEIVVAWNVQVALTGYARDLSVCDRVLAQQQIARGDCAAAIHIEVFFDDH